MLPEAPTKLNSPVEKYIQKDQKVRTYELTDAAPLRVSIRECAVVTPI